MGVVKSSNSTLMTCGHGMRGGLCRSSTLEAAGKRDFKPNFIEIPHATVIIATSCGLNASSPARCRFRCLPLTTSLHKFDLSCYLATMFDMSGMLCFTSQTVHA